MHKRGHLPTLFLGAMVIVVFLAVILAVLSYSDNYKTVVSSYHALGADSDFREEYTKEIVRAIVNDSLNNIGEGDFEKGFRENFEARFMAHEETGLNTGNIFGRVRNGDYEISNSNGIYVLTIEDVFIRSTYGVNEATKHFEVSVKFTDKEVLS